MRGTTKTRPAVDSGAVHAKRFAAIGNNVRLRILRLLLSAHPDGLIVGDLQSELDIPNSTLSHHLERLKKQDLVRMERQGSFLWYSVQAATLQELLNFLYAECCTRSKAVKKECIGPMCK